MLRSVKRWCVELYCCVLLAFLQCLGGGGMGFVLDEHLI